MPGQVRQSVHWSILGGNMGVREKDFLTAFFGQRIPINLLADMPDVRPRLQGPRSLTLTHYAVLVASVGTAVLATGCMTAPPPSGPAPQTPAAQAISAPPAQSGASALSYGTVTSRVLKGSTTQADLLQLFGGPNISTMDNDGVETWVYERSVSQTDVSSRSQSWQAAAGLGVFFGHVSANAEAGGGQAATAASTTASFRSLTVIVKFNQNKTVKDYSVRASQF